MTEENAEELRYINHQADRGLVEYEEFLDTICKITGVSRTKAHAEITTTHTPNESVFEIIKKLKQNDYKLGVISNVGDELSYFLPQAYVNLFDEITLSYHVKAIKPEPKIYEYHLDKLGLKPNETVFIDDREPNAKGAIAVGMHGLAYTNPEVLIEDLHNLGIKF